MSTKRLPILEWLLARRDASTATFPLPQLFAPSNASVHTLVWQAPTQDWSLEQVTGAVSVALTAVRGFHATLAGAHVTPVAQVGRGQVHELSLWHVTSRHLVTLSIEVYVAAQPPLAAVLVLDERAVPQPDSFAARLEHHIATALDAHFSRASLLDAPSPSSLRQP